MLVLTMITMLMMSVSAFAFDGGFGGGSVGSHGSGGGINPHWGSFGLKITLQRRADMLIDGGVNTNAYYNGLKQRSGMIMLYDAKATNTVSFNPNSEYAVTSGTGTTTVNNVGLSLDDFCYVLGLDSSEVDQYMKSVYRTGDTLDPQLDQISSFLTNKLNSESEDGILYDSAKRSSFYDLYEGTMNKYGLTSGITKEEFMGNVGVLVIEPVESLIDGWSEMVVNGIMTFQTADKFNSAVTDDADDRLEKWWFGTALRNNPTYKNVMYGTQDTNRAMTNLGSVTNAYDIDGDQIKWSAKHPDQVLADTGNNPEQGFLVFGMSYAGTSKAATNIAVRATQNADGNFTVDTVSSTISQQKGDMELPNNWAKPTQNNGITGGQLENYGDISTLTTSLWYDYYKDYTIEKCGSYLVKGTGSFSNIENNVKAFTDTLNGDMTANTESVTSGDFNAGKKYKPNWKHQTPQGTASAFAQSLFSGGYVSDNLFTNLNPSTGVDLNDVAYNLTAKANNLSKTGPASLVSTNNWYNAGSGKLETSTDADASYGVAVEFIMKPAQTSSYITYAKLKYDENLKPSLTVEKNDKVTYNKTDEGKFKIDKKRYYITVVSNCKANGSYKLNDNNRTGQSFWNVVKGQLKDGDVLTEAEFKNIVNNYLTSENTTSLSTKKDAVISLGSDGTCGYSVFILEIDAPEKIKVGTNFDLQDYQINFIHQDLLAPIGGVLTNSGESVKTLGSVGPQYCPVNGSNHNMYGTSQKYTVRHTNTNGKEVDVNSHSTNYFLGNSVLGARHNLQSLQSGYTSNTTSYDRYTYAYDLSRGLFGDIRNVSALSVNKVPQEALTALKSKHRMGVSITPSNGVGSPEASAKRNSKGTIFNGVAENITWSAQWAEGGRAPKDIVKAQHSSNGKTCTYQQQVISGARPLNYNGLGIYDLQVTVKDTIYKYSTDNLETGKNSKITTIKGDKTGFTLDSDILANKYNFDNNMLSNKVLGRKAVLADSSYKLNYYPEVAMKAYVVGGSVERQGIINGKNSITPTTVITMAERIRSTKPSSMYLMKLDSEWGSTPVTGSVFSDTMGTGTNSKNASKKKAGESKDNLPVIYGGSDVTVKVTPNKMKLHLYGYALDLVNYDVDKNGLKYADNTVQPYTDIVNDQSSANRNPYKTWGNGDTNSTTKMKDQYNKWVESVVNSLSADVTLKVTDKGEKTSNDTEGVKTFNNFNVSMPKEKAEDYKVDNFTTAYNIVVKRGEIDRTTAQYKALINQIASDYGCIKDEATDMFNKSDLYQSIVRSIEDIKDDFNKSQNVNTSENGSHAVRTDNTGDNWYDEEVKTFVVRRYESKPIELKDMVLTDKIDYNLSPDSNAGNKDKDGNKTGGQQSKYSTRVGQWYLTLYLKYDAKNGVPGNMSNQGVGEVDNLYLTGNTFYKPEADGSVNNINNSYNVIMNNMYISGADFKIPSASTSDTLW